MERYEPTDRVAMLREQSCQSPMMSESVPRGWGARRDLLLLEGWIAAAGQPTARLRRSSSRAYRIDHDSVVISDHELIVGCPDLSPLTEDEQARLAANGYSVTDCILLSADPDYRPGGIATNATEAR